MQILYYYFAYACLGVACCQASDEVTGEQCDKNTERSTTPDDMKILKDRYTKRYTGKLSYMGEYPVGLTACQLDPLPPIQSMQGWVPVSVGPKDFVSSLMCGSCLRISSRYEANRRSEIKDTTYNAIIVDQCSHCNTGDIRVYKEGTGKHDIIYEPIECPEIHGIDGYLRSKMNRCEDKRLKIQLKNTKLPVIAVEVFQEDEWKCLMRTPDNFYTIPLPTRTQTYAFPLKARATSITGQLLGFTVEELAEQTLPAQFLSLSVLPLHQVSPKLKCFMANELTPGTKSMLDMVKIIRNQTQAGDIKDEDEFDLSLEPDQMKVANLPIEKTVHEVKVSNLHGEKTEQVKCVNQTSFKPDQVIPSPVENKEQFTLTKEFPKEKLATRKEKEFKKIEETTGESTTGTTLTNSSQVIDNLLNASFCEDRRDGQYRRPGGDCSSFVVCTDRSPTAKTCPQGLLFNSDQQLCDWPKHVTCEESSRQNEEKAREKMPEVQTDEEGVFTKKETVVKLPKRKRSRINRYYYRKQTKL